MYERKCNLREEKTNDEIAIKTLGIKNIKKIVNTNEFTGDQYEKLFYIYQEEMPYGTQKARTGDPDIFIYNKLVAIVNKLQ